MLENRDLEEYMGKESVPCMWFKLHSSYRHTVLCNCQKRYNVSS